MTNIERNYSPDGRFFVLMGANEIRMSLWITSAALWDAIGQLVLLRFGDSSWSTEHVEWSADSRSLTVEMRRYPGDTPNLVLDVFPQRKIVIPRAQADSRAVPFDGLDAFLDEYYARYRRVGPAPAPPVSWWARLKRLWRRGARRP